MRAAVALLVLAARAAHAESAAAPETPLPVLTAALDPAKAAFGVYEGQASVGVARHVAIAFSYMRWTSSNDPGYQDGRQIALRVPIYFQERFAGPFVVAGAVVRTSDNSENTHSFIGPEFMAGYQYTRGAFTIAGAIGAAVPMFDKLGSLSTIDGYLLAGVAL